MSAHPTYRTPLRLGAWELKNRLVFAPSTRNRAHEPSETQAAYYAEKAQQAGLIISEGALSELAGYKFSNAPGIHEHSAAAAPSASSA